jgi:uncharacterized repeat protein (TIGR03806 family)
MSLHRFLCLVALTLCLAGCEKKPGFIAEGNPEKLSDWGMFRLADGKLTPQTGVVPYDLNTPLFSDYAAKLRTVWMPAGKSANYQDIDAFDFPVGTVITKTFYYPTKGKEHVLPYDAAPSQNGATGIELSGIRLIETRLLVRRESGWQVFPYLWNETQTEAMLSRTGANIPLTLEKANGQTADFTYAVPNVNQCASCHTPDFSSKSLAPIGLKARHINKPFAYADGAENQIEHLVKIGYLSAAPAADRAPRTANWRDASTALEDRARGYLDINCGHCHSAKGLARTTGLHLDWTVNDPRRLGLCKPPTAAGPGTGGHNFDLVPGQPDQSIMPFRLAGTAPGIRMPELGRSLAHEEGTALIRDWISAMKGQCDL